ncbi:hypothetical protein [Roseateles sp. LYH14W]|uniref:Uncharacterized protein n=1 Tax=Pelomonas parva TaxID=3299032 RepID=A0ABW7F8W3_9BURK
MNTKFYIPYFPSNPYGAEAPAKAPEAARAALEARLGGAWQVLAAKAAFEQAGGLHACWRGIYPPALTRWTDATRDALDAAYLAEPPRQVSIEDIDQLNSACIDVIATARYAYTQHEWLDAFTAHFGMSDYCNSREEAAAAGHRWLAIASQACPIAAAEQEIRKRSHTAQRLALPRDPTTIASAYLPRAINPETQGAPACF